MLEPSSESSTEFGGDAGNPNGPTPWQSHVDMRLDDGAVTMKELKVNMAENTATTKQLQSDTRELVALLESFRGAMRVLELLGKLAKPLGYIAAAVGACIGVWAALKGIK